MKRSDLKDAWSRLIEHDSFALACHVRPDGDCLGAALALSRVLVAMGKDVVVLSQDPVPEHYRFLPGSDAVLSETSRRDFAVGVLVDSDAPKRAGVCSEAVLSAPVLARIDHHLSTDDFGDIQIVSTEISSTSELVAEIFGANDIPIDGEIATLLLAGIIFDTGGFRYPNASARTFEIASHLAASGAKPAAIAREIFESRPLRAARILGRALSSMQSTEDGTIAWAEITQNDYAELKADDADTEGVVNTVAGVKGPRVAILFREVEPSAIRVSLRSRDGVDVNVVAKAFDGGGHAAAAGCTVYAPLAEAEKQVIDEVRRWMES